MPTDPNQPDQPSKRSMRDAQARHQSALFGGQPVQKPSSQRAETESRSRAQSLSQAAAQKRQALSDEEARKLAELQAKSRQGASEVRSQAPAQPPRERPAAPQKPASQLHQAAQRSDLAAEAVASMQRNLKPTPPAPASPQPAPAAQPTPPVPSQPPEPQRPAQPQAQPQPGQRPRRPAPNPEELDRLLREMAQRSAARRGGQAPPPGAPPRPAGRTGMPGAERAEFGPVAEAPPEPPPEVAAEEEKSAEKQAEILKELQAREAAAQRDIAPIPQADQERAEERAVEATVPIRTEGNAVSAAPLHAAIADLQDAMRAHNAPGQVEGVNVVQRHMPNHPLYRPETGEEAHGA